MNTNWYIIKVLPGKERILEDEFNKQINQGKIKDIVRFVCPTEKEYKTVKNKKQIRDKVIFSGYLYFETDKLLDEDELKFISSFNGIMGLMGDKTPIKLRQHEVDRLMKDINHDRDNNITLKYIVGESVKVIDGPFKTFDGTISKINDEKVLIDVKIFGRITSMELTLSQIEKIK